MYFFVFTFIHTGIDVSWSKHWRKKVAQTFLWPDKISEDRFNQTCDQLITKIEVIYTLHYFCVETNSMLYFLEDNHNYNQILQKYIYPHYCFFFLKIIFFKIVLLDWSLKTILLSLCILLKNSLCYDGMETKLFFIRHW